MSSKTQSPLQAAGTPSQSVISGHTELTGAKIIESFDEIPKVFQDVFRPYLSGGQVLPYTVLTPGYEVSGNTITAKLVFVVDHTFYALEENEHGVTKVNFPIDEISYVEVIHRQSDLSIRIEGFTNLGLPATSVFGCSKATDNIFAPLFQRIRLRIASLNEQAPSRHLERLDRWNDLKTKVLELARHCLLPGEAIIESILQPEIRPGLFSADRALLGGKSPAHICILTDKELILIREDLSHGGRNKSGGICNFISLNKIDTVSTVRMNENLLTFAARLPNGVTFESVFETAHEQEVEQFATQIRSLLPKKRVYIRDEGSGVIS